MNRAITADSEPTGVGPTGVGPTGVGPTGLGRPPVTSRAELEQISLAMFSAQGFEVTSVDDIAAAAGIGRRTFFRYFKSKNDAIWGDFDTQLDRFTQWFDECPSEMPILAAIRAGVIEFNSFDASATTSLKDRMRIILSSPALQAYSTLRYGAWRAVIVAFAAARLGVPETALVPRTLGHLALGSALAAYEQWLSTDGTDLIPLLEQSLSILTAGSVPGEADAPITNKRIPNHGITNDGEGSR